MPSTTELLTAIGSCLGTLAFIQNTFRSVAKENKAAWQAVQGICTVDDFVAVLRVVGFGKRHIKEVHVSRILELVRQLGGPNEALRFKSVVFDSFSSHIEAISQLGYELRLKLESPPWEFEASNTIPGDSYYVLSDREHLIQLDYTGPGEQPNLHLDELHAVVYYMLEEYKKLGRKASRSDFEYWLPWKWWAFR